MSDKILKELNKEELEQVSGGGWAEERSVDLPADHGTHIGKYAAENYIGQKFYIVDDADTKCYYWGTLLKSWEKDTWFGSERMHKFHIEGKNNYWFMKDIEGQDAEFSGDQVTLFLMH